MKSAEERLEELGLTLPCAPTPAGQYSPAVRVGNLVFCSGQGPIRDGEVVWSGRVGADRTLIEGREAAELCALNSLAVVKALIGSLDAVQRVVQVRGFVSSAPGFHDQPEVVDGASELLKHVFGQRGEHARAALGSYVLPKDISVEVEVIFEVAGQSGC